jgi:YidC/Oxa1 family membrane protein insertase
MDRKAVITILITAGILLGWHFGYYAPRAKKNEEAIKAYQADLKRKQEEEKAKQPASPAPATQPGATTPGATAQPAPATVPAVTPAEPAVPEQRKILSSVPGTVTYEFTSQGGGIIRGTLNEHFKDKSKGTQVVINEFGSIPIGAMTELPGEDSLVKLPWKMSMNETDRTVSFERTDDARKIKITKTFVLPRDKSLSAEYCIGVDVTFTNIGKKAMMVPTLFIHTGSAAPVNAAETRQYQGFDWWRDGTNNFQNVDWFSAGGMLAWSHPERPIFQLNGDKIRWSGVTNQYFTTLVTILGYDAGNDEDLVKNLGTAVWAKRTAITAETWREAGHSIDGGKQGIHKVDGALAMPGFALNAGDKLTKHFRIYSGPREYRRLRLLDNKEKDVLDYQAFLGIIPTGPFSKLLLNSMNGLFAITGSYALAIVLLTICVKALLWPLQNKANKNMKKMSALQPEMKRLQEKYKQEPVKFQQEMGKVWKKAGVNPLSGCWPILIQIPVFIGFYSMLGKAVELRHHGFWWVKDLSQPDTVFTLGFLPVNPLPLLMAVTMIAQMKLSPQSGDPAQRKMMMFMPLIFIFMCYNFASALALYWTIQNLISIVQLQINKRQQSVTLVPTSA